MEKLASKGHKVKIAKDEDETAAKEMAQKLQEL
jgi:predicted dinucleotide-binding enzyme